jgi:hypothetical protein
MNQAKAIDAPLSAEVIGEQLVIRVGIATLVFAAEHSTDWNPYDDLHGRFVQAFRVEDSAAFAKDIAGKLLDDREDGSTPLGDLLDTMSMKVVQDGELSIEVCPQGTPSVYERDNAGTEGSNIDT